MSATFPRTLRALQSDSPRRAALALACGAALLGAWLAWFAFARIPVHAASREARLEVDSATHRVDAPVAGRIRETAIDLGARVEHGDVLVRFEDGSQQLQLEEERSRLEALGPQVEALRAQIAAEESALEGTGRSSAVAVSEARARERQTQSAASFARQQAERAERLHEEGQVSAAELERLRTEAHAKAEAAMGARLARERAELEPTTTASDRRARIESLRVELARLEGEVASTTAAVARLEEDVAQRVLRAPVSGRIASDAGLRSGAVVEAGRELASIVPDGELRIVAQFEPGLALGRVRPGQPARVRLDGFPWTQYGSVAAQVRDVASEARGGLLRVELGLADASTTTIPLEHGMTGVAEVEVDRASPASLVLRAAGGLVSDRHE